ncbi:MAG: S49 family peptidase, partial [Pseudomonadota bacterium]
LRRRLAGSGAPVAVLRLRGAVVSRAPEHGGRDVIAADRVVPLLDRLREDDGVRGVLLCVDSPGGSALASERLARAVERLQAEKPVVALFQGVAASGGYYLAVPAGVLYAQPGTVTGSIGVVGVQVRMMPALGRIGVHATALSTTPGSDLDQGLRAMSRPERARIEGQIHRFYDLFLQRVTAGRRRPRRAIEPVAGGRVWSGRAALRHGLVDRLGTFHDALHHLYSLVGLLPRPGFEPRLDLGRAEPGLLPRLARSLLGGAVLRAWPGLGLLVRLAEAIEPPAGLDAVLEAGARPAVLAVGAWTPDP